MKKTMTPLVSLSLLILTVMTGAGAVSSILPEYTRDFGVSITVVGLVLATNNIVRMIFGFLSGALTDKWGRKPFVLLGMLLATIGALVSWSATDIQFLFVGQALIGAGTAFFSTAILTMVIDIADDPNRGRTTGLYMTGYHIGTVFGPAVGGWLAFRFGPVSPFLLSGILTAMAAIATLIFVQESHPRKAKGHRLSEGKLVLSPIVWKNALNRNLGIVCLVNFAFRFCFNGLIWTVLPVLALDLRLDNRTTGIVFVLVGIISLFSFYPTGVLADRLGRRNILIPGAIMSAIALAMFMWANSLPFIIIASVLLGLSNGFISTLSAALVGDYATEETKGTAIGFYRSIGDLGLVLSPAVLGLIGDRIGLSASSLVILTLWSITTVSLFLLPAYRSKVAGVKVR